MARCFFSQGLHLRVFFAVHHHHPQVATNQPNVNIATMLLCLPVRAGSIPKQLAELSSLQRLHVSNNSLTGGCPESCFSPLARA